MNKAIYFFSVAIVLLSACMKQEAETGNDPQPYNTCDDGVKNYDETGIDCGGHCPQCQPFISAKVDGQPFSSTGNSVSAQVVNGNFLLISGADSLGNYIQFNYGQAFAAGTYYNVNAAYVRGSTNYTTTTATLTFTEFNTAENLVAGNFSFTGLDFNSGGTDSVVITEGLFSNINYP